MQRENVCYLIEAEIGEIGAQQPDYQQRISHQQRTGAAHHRSMLVLIDTYNLFAVWSSLLTIFPE